MEFRKVSHSVHAVLGKALKYFLVTASLAVVYYIVFSLLISTDSERRLEKENQAYRDLYADMVRKEGLVDDVLKGLEARDNEIYMRLFNSPAPDLGGLQASIVLSDADSVSDRHIVEYTARKLDALTKASARIEENLKTAVEEAERKGSGLPPMSIPLADFAYARTGASLGLRINPFYKVSVMHGGLDLISQQGEPVLAAADGTVSEVVHSNKGLGNVVTIDHGNGYVSRYAHLENTRVFRGQRVSRGQQVGQVGMSGNSFAPHLHYEVLKDTLRLDPLNCLFASVGPDEYMGMLLMSLNTGQSMD